MSIKFYFKNWNKKRGKNENKEKKKTNKMI